MISHPMSVRLRERESSSSKDSALSSVALRLECRSFTIPSPQSNPKWLSATFLKPPGLSSKRVLDPS